MDTATNTAAPEAAVNEAVLSSDAATPTPVTIVETPKPSMDDDLRATWDKMNPPRDKGKFAPRNKPAPEVAAAETTPEPATETPAETNSTDQPVEAKTEPAKPVIDVPASWSAEMKAKWASLPPDAQTYIAQRDKEAQQAISRIGNERKGLEDRLTSYKPLDELIEANKDQFARRGLTPVQAFSTLLNAQSQLDANPLMGLVQIGLGYGIDLRQFLPQGTVPQPSPLPPEVVELKATVAQLQNHFTEQQKAAQKAAEAKNAETETALRQQIEDFRKDKPHFEALQPIMAGLLTSGAAETLEQAYEQAKWASPEVRERIQADQRAADEANRKAEQAKRAAAAQKSAQVNVKSATASGQNPKTMDDDLWEIAARRYGT